MQTTYEYEACHRTSLSESISANLIVCFRCVSPGYRGDYWEPGEGPEFEIDHVEIEELWAEDGTDMTDWAPFAQAAADDVDPCGDLYDAMCDAYHESH